MKVLITCHAGIGIGLGHLSRSLVIAKALQDRFGAEVQWLIQSDPLARHELSAFQHRFVPPDHDLATARAGGRDEFAGPVETD